MLKTTYCFVKMFKFLIVSVVSKYNSNKSALLNDVLVAFCNQVCSVNPADIPGNEKLSSELDRHSGVKMS